MIKRALSDIERARRGDGEETAPKRQKLQRRRRSQLDRFVTCSDDTLGLSFLEGESVTQATVVRYGLALERIQCFLGKGLAQLDDPEVDGMMVEYLEHLFLEGRSAADASLALAAWEFKGLQGRDIVKPVRGGPRGYSPLIAPSEMQEPTKTGEFSDSVPCNSPGPQFLCENLERPPRIGSKR